MDKRAGVRAWRGIVERAGMDKPATMAHTATIRLLAVWRLVASWYGYWALSKVPTRIYDIDTQTQVRCVAEARFQLVVKENWALDISLQHSLKRLPELGIYTAVGFKVLKRVIKCCNW